MTAAELEVMSDRDIAICANGSYGLKMRAQFFAALRSALRRVRTDTALEQFRQSVAAGEARTDATE